jgi:crotonobetainyl-CoA:carnitine CoA-transferase CaiB-like acyl-CoA transferase
MNASEDRRPLAGVRVLEMGQLVAGPFAGAILGYFGADVIRVEPPEGDPIRSWRGLQDGTSLWWRTIARNKRSVALDLRAAEGRAIAGRLARSVDVLIENFRPGRMEAWGLGPAALHADHPGLVYVRVSGYGQDGPSAARPGYASVCEAAGGLRHLTGEPDGPSVRPNLSIGDSLAGLHAALGALLALRTRDRDGRGQVVDVALVESVFNMLESVVPEFAALGTVRGPSGASITGVVPTGTWRCADGRSVVIGANSDPVFRRCMRAIGRPDLADDPALQTNEGRVSQRGRLDAALEAYCAAHDSASVRATLDAASVPVGPINDVADLFDDPHLQARGLFERVGGFTLPAMAPRLVDTPGHTAHAGPELGAHTGEVLREILGLDAEALRRLEADGVVCGTVTA